jgi:TPR repeat protein
MKLGSKGLLSPLRITPGANPLLVAASAVLAVVLSVSCASAQDWPAQDLFAAGTTLIFPGEGAQDVAKGIALIDKAADAGNPEAQYALAILYRQGGLIGRDETRARDLLQRAAAMGVPEAQTVLGQDMLETIEKYDDPTEGRALLQKAADAGNLTAHSYLGTSLLEKTPLDYERAIKHLTIAAEGDIVPAQLMLGIAYYNGGGLYRSRAEPDHKRGFEWISRAVEGGSALAWTWTGWAYQDGKAVPKDLEKAAAAWRRAAEMGDAPGANQLSLAYRDGIGVRRNPKMQQHWLERAAELGHQGAQEVIERQQILSEKHSRDTLAILLLLGLALGAAGDGSPPPQARFMDPTSDPMQAWGNDIVMRIK